ncbi:MAG: hypothetical protein HZB87_12050, partial [Desulfatitalea sp.]|nr:hypothetical protein [Desulfatitalea sp.]
MAEIEVKKGRDAAVPEPSSEAPTEDKSISPKKAGENLTMEEFDDELSNLLSSAQAAPAAKTVAKTKTMETSKPAAVEPATAADTGKTVEPAKATSDKFSGKEGPQAKKEYPILKEVSVDPKSKPKKNKGTPPGRNEKGARQSRKTATVAVLAIGLLVICIGSYWGYRHQWRMPSVPVTAAPDSAATAEQVKPVVVHSSPEHAVVSQPVAVAPAGTPESLAAEVPVKPMLTAPMETPAMMLSAANSELASARQQIQTKISDIQQLKSYYGRGIEEETQKIEDALKSGLIPSFDAALADKKIELGMRAIQRRHTYMAKLDNPLTQLASMSEQLLYMERRARIYDVLQAGITGLPIEAFKKEVDETIGQYLEFNTQISIDRVELQPPTLETIWAQIESGLKQKANLLAQRAPLNQAISAEICKGNYERKYLLGALSAETAHCLVKWNGKDLYLNGLTELTPEVAEILVQWPGEWISLNGLRQLNAES